MRKFHSDISNSEFPISERVSGRMVSPSILILISKDNPQFTIDKFLSLRGCFGICKIVVFINPQPITPFGRENATLS